MRVLIIASGNANALNPFIADQMNALKKAEVDMDYFLIKGSGVSGYLKNYKPLLKKIKAYDPDIIYLQICKEKNQLLPRFTDVMLTLLNSDSFHA